MTEDSSDRSQDIAHISTLIPRVITREDNEMLIKPISMQEVEEAIIHIPQRKSLVLGGFTTNFFHFFWDVIKE